MLCRALFLSYLNCCVVVWGTASKCYVSLITLVQNKFIHMIAKVDKYSDMDPLFKDIEIYRLEPISYFNINVQSTSYILISYLCYQFFLQT